MVCTQRGEYSKTRYLDDISALQEAVSTAKVRLHAQTASLAAHQPQLSTKVG